MRLRNEYFGVVEEGRLVRVTRSDQPFPEVADMEHAMEELNRRLHSLGRAGRRLLVDTRQAPPRNDAEFERAFAPQRRRLLTGFDRHAVLVRTEVGRLQVSRHARMDGTDMRAFRDEESAIAWLSG